MKITIEENGKSVSFEVPEWALERRLTLLAGVELVAEKFPWSDWEVKKERCNNCGECCMNFRPNSNQTPFGVDDEGKCKALKKEGKIWVCSMGTQRPYDCLHDPNDVDECSIVREILRSK